MHRHISLRSTQTNNHILLQRRKEQQFSRRLNLAQPAAWVQLVNRWSPKLYTYIAHNVDSEDEIRMLMHRILADVVRSVVRKSPTENLTVLIFSTAYRYVLRYRWQYPNALDAHSEATSNAVSASPLNRRNQKSSFLHRFHQFSLETQQLLLLRYVCHVELSDLSQIVGQPEDVLIQTFHSANLYLQ